LEYQIKNFMMVICLILISSLSSAADIIENNLDKLYSEYKEPLTNPNITNLVHLDTNIRKFISQLPKYRGKNVWSDTKYWKKKYSDLGLSIGHYSDRFGYSGKFLFQAHKIDPNSKNREYTLYSEVITETSHGLGQMPNIKSAYQYTKEFPNGPFISKVLLIIANFHKDLFMVIRNNDNRKINYKFDCFKPYIEKAPHSEQMKRNKKIAITYYLKVLKINSENSRAKRFIEELKDGTVNGWSFCAD